MKKIRIRVAVQETKPGIFHELYRMLEGAGYQKPEVALGQPNEIVVVLEGRCGPDAADGYHLETGCLLGLVRGFLAGKGHIIDSYSVIRIG